MTATYLDSPSYVEVIAPDLVLGWAPDREVRTVVHNILDRADPDVTLRPAATASGDLRLFFLDYADAQDAQDRLASGAVWTLHLDDLTPTVEVTFVVTGRVGLAAEEPDFRRWVVTASFREVSP